MRRAHSLDVIGPLSEELLGGDWKRVVTFGDDVRARDGPPRRLGQRLVHRGVRLVAELGDRAPGGQGIDVVEEHGLRRHGFDVVANYWAATEPRPGHQRAAVGRCQRRTRIKLECGEINNSSDILRVRQTLRGGYAAVGGSANNTRPIK